MTVRAGWRPDPTAWHLKSWGGWVPERLFPAQVSAPPCPTCADGGRVNAASAKWQKRMPRIVLSLTERGGWFFLDAKTYRCTQCKVPFLASHPESVAKLPTEVKMQFGLLQGSGLGWISLWHGECFPSGSSPYRLRASRQLSTRNGGEIGSVLKPRTALSLPLALLANSNILPWRQLTGRRQSTSTWCEVRRQRDLWRSRPRRHRQHRRLRRRGAADDLLRC